MKGSNRVGRVKVSADGTGVASHAGVGMLRETAAFSGLVQVVTEALIDTYAGVPVHAPGQVFCDLAVAVADGADAISGIGFAGRSRNPPGDTGHHAGDSRTPPINRSTIEDQILRERRRRERRG